jgi:hypothetical protein
MNPLRESSDVSIQTIHDFNLYFFGAGFATCDFTIDTKEAFRVEIRFYRRRLRAFFLRKRIMNDFRFHAHCGVLFQVIINWRRK